MIYGDAVQLEQHVGTMRHVRLILVTRTEEVGWMPHARGRILDGVDLPSHSTDTAGTQLACAAIWTPKTHHSCRSIEVDNTRPTSSG